MTIINIFETTLIRSAKTNVTSITDSNAKATVISFSKTHIIIIAKKIVIRLSDPAT